TEWNRQARLLRRLDAADVADDVIVDDRGPCMNRDRRELADDQVLRPERVGRRLVRRELLDGNHVRSDLGRCRDVFRRYHGRHVLRSSNRYRAARGSANEQGPSKRHNGKENTEDQEDAVALRLNLRRQSTHLLILGVSAPRRDAPSGHVSISERSSLRKREKEREPAFAGSLLLLPRTKWATGPGRPRCC